MDAALLFDADTLAADLGIDKGDLVAESGLKTAVLISLFTDRRADADDKLPAEASDRRGWWGDLVPPAEGDRIGSKLWLLSREKTTDAILNRAREYAREALEWLVEDGVAKSVEVAAEYIRTGFLAIGITITRPDLREIDFRFQFAWESL